jgi:all-trans-retinol dehydrogenase (NAD+)
LTFQSEISTFLPNQRVSNQNAIPPFACPAIYQNKGGTMNLESKCAVITGGAMGIGFATAQRLLHERCLVTLWDINEKALNDAKVQLENTGGKIFTHVCDVTDRKRVYELAELATKEMGKVDILINNAGYVMGGEFLERSDEVWEKTVHVNLTAMLYTIRAFLPGMYERNSGHIVNISSAAGTIGVPGLAVYAATKWAVWGLTESLRLEAPGKGKKGMKYSSIHPSYIAHGMFEGARLGLPGRWIVPLLKDHDVIARAIVESALKKGHTSPKRPRTVNLNLRIRSLLPDSWFQRFLVLMGVPGSMKNWRGRSENP